MTLLTGVGEATALALLQPIDHICAAEAEIDGCLWSGSSPGPSHQTAHRADGTPIRGVTVIQGIRSCTVENADGIAQGHAFSVSGRFVS